MNGAGLSALSVLKIQAKGSCRTKILQTIPSFHFKNCNHETPAPAYIDIPAVECIDLFLQEIEGRHHRSSRGGAARQQTMVTTKRFGKHARQRPPAARPGLPHIPGM